MAGFCLLAAILFFKSGRFTIRILDKLQVRLEARLGRFLDERHGLFFLATMDGPHPVDAVSRAPLHIRKAERSQGKIGDARRIDLDHNVLIRADLMGKLTKSATFAAWFRPFDTSRKQLLFNARSHEDGFVLVLENNALSLSVTTTNGQMRVSCPFAGVSNRFTHVAVTFSQSEATVFQNGRESCALPVKRTVGFPRKPLLYGTETFWPFEGDIDELAIWQRALDAREIAGVARARKGVRYLYEPWHAGALTTVSWLSRTVAPTYRVIDRLLPRRRVTASMAKDIPLFMVWPSKADERHFSHAHAISSRNGFRSRKAAEFRRIDMAVEGDLVSLDLALDDVYSVGEPKRMAYVVRDPSRTVFGGSGLVRLYPPELHSVLHADTSCPLPLSAKFVRLFFGNVFQGVYVVESFDREGGSWMAYGSHIEQATNSIGYRERSSVSEEPPSGAARDAAFSRVTSIVASDVFFPWSRQEILARCRERETISEILSFNRLKNHFPREILNGNLSPLYVTGDLNLQGDPQIRWDSSDPDIVSESGKVTRPVSGPPRAVVLTPVDIRRGPRKPVRVRVISQKPRLQALFLHVASPVDKYTRNDFSCLRMPAGGGEGEWLTGTAATGGGAHHRGNTSYIKGVKRSLSLKFDEPVAMMEDQLPARHVFLFCGYADPSRLRNRISFDAYRAAAGGRTPNGITAIDWSEVFINGEYFGVWELAHRVRDIFAADEGLLFKIRSQHPQLWTIPLPDMAEAIAPPDIRADTSLPLTDILKTIADAKPDDFPAMAHRDFFFDSLVDYFLMLNFTQNYDGQVVNQYLAKDSASGKWFVIPWDYDKTFFNADPAILSNRLVTRLWMDVPEFRRECRGKWKALRAGALSDEAVLSRIDAYAELLAPYMEEEYRLKQPAGWTGDFPAAIDKLKETVSARLKALDRHFK